MGVRYEYQDGFAWFTPKAPATREHWDLAYDAAEFDPALDPSFVAIIDLREAQLGHDELIRAWKSLRFEHFFGQADAVAVLIPPSKQLFVWKPSNGRMFDDEQQAREWLLSH